MMLAGMNADVEQADDIGPGCHPNKKDWISADLPTKAAPRDKRNQASYYPVFAGQRCQTAGQRLEEVGARGRCLSDRNVSVAIETIANAADCAHDVFEVTEL